MPAVSGSQRCNKRQRLSDRANYLLAAPSRCPPAILPRRGTLVGVSRAFSPAKSASTQPGAPGQLLAVPRNTLLRRHHGFFSLSRLAGNPVPPRAVSYNPAKNDPTARPFPIAWPKSGPPDAPRPHSWYLSQTSRCIIRDAQRVPSTRGRSHFVSAADGGLPAPPRQDPMIFPPNCPLLPGPGTGTPPVLPSPRRV